MIQINYRDTRPFYQQIKDNVRHLVVSGALKKDDKLPSVRELAASLAINPNTIQRAYAELERQDIFIRLRAGAVLWRITGRSGRGSGRRSGISWNF